MRILAIDHDAQAIDTIGRVLEEEGHHVLPARNGDAGLRAVQAFDPNVALISVDLPDRSSVDLVRTFCARSPSPACVVLADASQQHFDDIIEAMRLGAVDCVRKPLRASDLLRAVRRLSSLTTGTPQTTFLHAHERWAQIVIRAVTSPSDLRTLYEWGRWTGASSGSIRNWCRTARLSSRRSLLFARALRAVARQHDARSENLLNIVDRRTLTKIVLLSGGSGTTLPASVEDFFQRQRFIDDEAALKLVARLLANLGRDKSPNVVHRPREFRRDLGPDSIRRTAS
jgi:DNA-binding NarL/FixJ family response regulator